MKVRDILGEQIPQIGGAPKKQPTNPIGVIRQGKKIYDIAKKPGGIPAEIKRQGVEYIKNKTRDDASSRNRAGDKENQVTGMWNKIKGIFSKNN